MIAMLQARAGSCEGTPNLLLKMTLTVDSLTDFYIAHALLSLSLPLCASLSTVPSLRWLEAASGCRPAAGSVPAGPNDEAPLQPPSAASAWPLPPAPLPPAWLASLALASAVLLRKSGSSLRPEGRAAATGDGTDGVTTRRLASARPASTAPCIRCCCASSASIAASCSSLACAGTLAWPSLLSCCRVLGRTRLENTPTQPSDFCWVVSKHGGSSRSRLLGLASGGHGLVGARDGGEEALVVLQQDRRAKQPGRAQDEHQPHLALVHCLRLQRPRQARHRSWLHCLRGHMRTLTSILCSSLHKLRAEQCKVERSRRPLTKEWKQQLTGKSASAGCAVYSKATAAAATLPCSACRQAHTLCACTQ